MDNNIVDFDYAKLIDEAMLSLVKKCLLKVKEHGLSGNHHFYITFLTEFPDVEIPQELKQQYPKEMTVVLQHQFWDLDINDKFFTVALSFNNVRRKLIIPVESIISFADPSVKFGLQFQYKRIEDRKNEIKNSAATKKPARKTQSTNKKVTNIQDAKIVSLENFRKSKKKDEK